MKKASMSEGLMWTVTWREKDWRQRVAELGRDVGRGIVINAVVVGGDLR